jgi:predicted phosphodiesterase
VSAPSKKLSRVGILGDVHAEDDRLARALEVLRGEEVDAILCVGDIADGPGDLDRTCALLQEEGVVTVMGNHDRWLLAGERRDRAGATPPDAVSDASRRFLASLPPTLEMPTILGGLQLCHGVGDDDLAALEPTTSGYSLQAIPTLRELMLHPEVSYAIGGHTHQRMIRRFQGLVFINPGTLLRDHDPCFALAELHQHKVRFFDFKDGDRVEVGSMLDLPLPAPLP